MATTPTVEACAKSAGQRLREALAELVQQQASDSTPRPPTATALCELAGVSRNALYRYHPDVLEELRKLQQQQGGVPGPAKQEDQQLREENKDLRHQVTALAALVDHYFAAWQETRTLLERRERELAELRRNTKPKLVSNRN
jgi:AcrR family transcriptional regulator